jgi:hypothetical protein
MTSVNGLAGKSDLCGEAVSILPTTKTGWLKGSTQLSAASRNL